MKQNYTTITEALNKAYTKIGKLEAEIDYLQGALSSSEAYVDDMLNERSKLNNEK